MAASGGVAWPRGDGGEPAPGLAVVCGFRDANFAAGIGVFHAGVEEAAIDDLDCASIARLRFTGTINLPCLFQRLTQTGHFYFASRGTFLLCLDILCLDIDS